MASGETFLFNPENEGLIMGQKKQPAVDSSLGCLALFMVPFVLAGLLILGLAVSEWVRLVRLTTDFAIVDGRLVSQEIDRSDHENRHDAGHWRAFLDRPSDPALREAGT